MIVITDHEISNGHGTGVLLKNILDCVGDKENIVLCKRFLNDPDKNIDHYLFDDHNFYRGNKYVRKMMLTQEGASLYFRYKKPKFAGVPLHQHKLVLVTIYTMDVFWIALKFMRLYPEKTYILFIMDLFMEFGSDSEGKLNRSGIKAMSQKVIQTLAISQPMANVLQEASGVSYTPFFGPRKIDWSKVASFHNTQKDNKICLVGNAWVESALPMIDKQLGEYGLTVTWFTGKRRYDFLQERYQLKNLQFGGSFSSEEVLEQIASFRFGLILYGLDVSAEDAYNKKLQEFSIPSKVIDYCMSGLEPVYYGPSGTACDKFLAENDLGVSINNKTAPAFFDSFNTLAQKPIHFEKMKNILLNASTETFLKLINKSPGVFVDQTVSKPLATNS